VDIFPRTGAIACDPARQRFATGLLAVVFNHKKIGMIWYVFIGQPCQGFLQGRTPLNIKNQLNPVHGPSETQ
jgi:hypothetical protein